MGGDEVTVTCGHHTPSFPFVTLYTILKPFSFFRFSSNQIYFNSLRYFSFYFIFLFFYFFSRSKFFLVQHYKIYSPNSKESFVLRKRVKYISCTFHNSCNFSATTARDSSYPQWPPLCQNYTCLCTSTGLAKFRRYGLVSAVVF